MTQTALGMMLPITFAMACALSDRLTRMRASVRKVGGLYFWRVGRFGGSFYIAR